MRSIRLTALIVALVATSSLSAQIAVYTFGTSGSPTTAANSSDANLTAGSFTVGGDVTGTLGTSSPASSSIGGSGSQVYRGAGDGFKPEGTAGYFEVVLTPNSGYSLSISGVEFNSIRTSTGATNWDLQYSVDGGGYTSLDTGSNASGAWTAQDTGSVTITGIDSNITFRLFGTGASSAAGSFRIDDFSVSGSLSAVPEPASFAAFLGLGALGLVATRRRGKKSSPVAVA